MLVGNLGARAGHLFIDRKQQSDPGFAIRPQLFGRRDLGSDNSLRIAGPAPVNEFVVFARSDMRRHGVHVR